MTEVRYVEVYLNMSAATMAPPTLWLCKVIYRPGCEPLLHPVRPLWPPANPGTVVRP